MNDRNISLSAKPLDDDDLDVSIGGADTLIGGGGFDFADYKTKDSSSGGAATAIVIAATTDNNVAGITPDQKTIVGGFKSTSGIDSGSGR